MSVEGLSRVDIPKQIVRPLMDGEALPLYSTTELLLGVCHFVRRPSRPAPLAIKPTSAQPAIKAGPARTAMVRATLNRVRSEIIERLAVGDSNSAIAERLNLPLNQVLGFMRTCPQLREASAKSPRPRGGAKSTRAASERRFLADEAEIRKTVADSGVYFAGTVHGFSFSALKRLLAEVKA